MSKRESIITETLNRLNAVFKNTHIIERGKLDIEESSIPCIYLYEDVENIVRKQWDNYICTLPLQIDIYDRAYDMPYEIGNNYFNTVKSALELDRDYNKIAISYGCILRYVDITLRPLVKTTLVYEFTYNEFFGK